MQPTSVKRVLFDVTVINKNPVLTLTKKKNVGLCRAMYGYVALCMAMYGDVVLCMAM